MGQAAVLLKRARSLRFSDSGLHPCRICRRVTTPEHPRVRTINISHESGVLNSRITDIRVVPSVNVGLASGDGKPIDLLPRTACLDWRTHSPLNMRVGQRLSR
jgi:hypothetical protein